MRESPRMKVVGRRRVERDRTDWADVARLLRTASALRGAWPLRRGVYRFSTFEEADQWMIQTLASGRAPRRSKTSAGSAAR